MSTAWVVAVLALGVLLLALTLVVVRLLAVVSSVDQALVALRTEVAGLRAGATGALESGAVAPERAVTVLVSLEPGCAGCRELALDLRASGLPEVGGVGFRLLAEDTAAGRELVTGLVTEPAAPAGPSLPHVLVLAATG